MPECDFIQLPSTAGDTPADAQAEFEAERRCLIDNIAFLVVRQHRRRQLDEGDPGKPNVHRSPRTRKDEKRPIQPGEAAATG